MSQSPIEPEGMPELPKTAFFIFCKDKIAENKKYQFTELADLYLNLPKDVQEKYQMKSEETMKEYAKEIAKLREKKKKDDEDKKGSKKKKAKTSKTDMEKNEEKICNCDKCDQCEKNKKKNASSDESDEDEK